MPSISKKQQNFFRLVKAVKAGKIKKKDVDKSVRKAAKSMTKKQISDFADHISEGLERDNILYRMMNEYTEWDLLDDFMTDKETGVETVQFDLIPAAQYKNLLNRFMAAPSPEAARIPEKVVDEWLNATALNFLKILYISEFAGHSSSFPSEYCADMFGEDECWEKYDTAWVKLEDMGFYDWCKLPDGSDAWSDYGIDPIFKIFSEYRQDMEPYEKLILINRVLDVGHCRGDLASAFIEGGSKTCSEVSGLCESFFGSGVMKFEEFCKRKMLW